MILNYKKFLESNTYHSITDIYNLARQIKDFTYNNDVKENEYFKSIIQTKDGYVIEFSFNGDKKYTIKKDKVTNKDGVEIPVDEAYYNLDMLFNMIKTYLNSYNIQQIDEAMEFEALKNDLMVLVEKSAKMQNLKTDEFIKNWVDENSTPEKTEKTVTLEGLIQDEDIFDFYLKHKEDVDKLLEKDGYFGRNQGVRGLYEYVIDGTKQAIFLSLKNK